MYWADNFAKEIKKSGKYKPYWVDDMKTPSGRVHIGSVRAVLTHDILYKALLDMGLPATFSYVLEDHDPMDSLPNYLDPKEYEKHLGKPLYKIPSPEKGYKSYGHRWGQEYIDVFHSLEVNPKIIWGSELYLSGKMNEVVRICLDKAETIRGFYKKLYGEAKPVSWYPFNPVCEKCGKLATTEVSDWDGEKVTYECRVEGLDWTKGCGNRGQVSPFDGNGKLPWKVEWPCKWKVIGVTVEGAGKDHMSEGGSHDFAKLMCKKVLDYEVPFDFSHEFFLVGGKKMSSSKGLGSSAIEVARILPPQLIRFMVAKVPVNRAINFDPGGMTIPDLFDEYEMAAKDFWGKKGTSLARAFEFAKKKGELEKEIFLPRFRDVARYLQHPEIDMDKKFAELKGKSLSNEEEKVLAEMKKYAQIWLNDHAPKEEIFIPGEKAPKEVKSLTTKQKEYLVAVAKLLEEEWKEPENLQQALYDKSQEMDLSGGDAFGAIYKAMIGKDHGPKAAWFLLSYRDLAKKRFKNLTK